MALEVSINFLFKKCFEYFSVFVSELGFIEQKTMQKLKLNFRDVTITILHLPSAASSQKLVGITRDFDLAAFFCSRPSQNVDLYLFSIERKGRKRASENCYPFCSD